MGFCWILQNKMSFVNRNMSRTVVPSDQKRAVKYNEHLQSSNCSKLTWFNEFQIKLKFFF